MVRGRNKLENKHRIKEKIEGDFEENIEFCMCHIGKIMGKVEQWQRMRSKKDSAGGEEEQ